MIRYTLSTYKKSELFQKEKVKTKRPLYGWVNTPFSNPSAATHIHTHTHKQRSNVEHRKSLVAEFTL